MVQASIDFRARTAIVTVITIFKSVVIVT